MSSRSSRLSALERLKNRSQGNVDIDSDEEVEDFDMNRLREEMDDDGDFVVDDNDGEYTGGFDAWMAEDRKMGRREKKRESRRKNKKSKEKATTKPTKSSGTVRSRKEKQRERSRRNESRKEKKQPVLSDFMTAGATKSSSTRVQTRSKADSQAYLASILDDLDDSEDENMPIIRKRPSQRPRVSARRSTKSRRAMMRENRASAPLEPLENDVPMATEVYDEDVDEKDRENEKTKNSSERTSDDTGPPCAKKVRLDPSVVNEPKMKSPPATETMECPTYEKMDLDDMNVDIEQLDISPQGELPPPILALHDQTQEDLLRDGRVPFYWIDAYEDVNHHPGVVFLFGKAVNPKSSTNELVSCCVSVKNIQRSVYFLPRKIDPNDPRSDRIESAEVAKEITESRKKYRIGRVKMELVSRKYGFHGLGDVPPEAEYVHVRYSFRDMPYRTKSGQTYERVFGTRSTALELLLLECELRGPGWLSIPFHERPGQQTWCKLELELESQKDIVKIENMALPPLRVMSLAIQTTLTKKKKHEIACLSCLVADDVDVAGESDNVRVVDKFSVVRKIDKAPYPFDLQAKMKQGKTKFHMTSNERELLNLFTTKIQKWDPDVIVSHKLFDFTLDVLFHRMEALKVNQWSKVGRLRRNKLPFYNGRLQKQRVGCGRLMCCTFMSAQEFVHEKTYTLSNLVDRYCDHPNHSNIDANLMQSYWADSRDLIKVVAHCECDAWLILKLMTQLQMLPLTWQLTSLCGNIWQKSLLSKRAERNEYLLLHEFHSKGYIVPEKYNNEEKLALGIVKEKVKKKTKREAQYKGGMVLEPKVGLYDKFVILLDFNSLYPSIIQEYNLCFTTVPHYRTDESAEENPEAFRPPSHLDPGVLPTTIGILLDKRKEVKRAMKTARTEADRKRMDIRQKALKLVANSMYGCLGFENSRFYCKPIASLITAFGRQNLENAARAATSVDERLKVIYGDTDSIMVFTGTGSLSEARRLGREVKKQVNKSYTKMYLELDEVFTKVLLLRKKKYATLKLDGKPTISPSEQQQLDGTEFMTATQCANAYGYTCKREVKGLDVVRRDWAVLSKEIGQEVLDIILSDESVDDVVANIHECLRQHGQAIQTNRVPLEKYQITKKLTKHPRDYPDAAKQPHVQVAIQMQNMGLQVNVGDVIPYIFCVQRRENSQSKSLSSRAYHMKEIIDSHRSLGSVNRSDEKETDDQNGQQPQRQALEVDRTYYLENQILPPIARYCLPIEGTDPAQLASCLGLDGAKFARAKRNGVVDDDEDDDNDEDSFLFMGNPNEMYAQCERLTIKCSYCGVKIPFPGIFKFDLDASSGFRCPTTNCRGLIDEYDTTCAKRDMERLKNTIQRRIMSFVTRYYNRTWICRDQTCGYSTRQLPLGGPMCPKLGCSSAMLESYNAQELFTQIRYFLYLFDEARATKIFQEEKKDQSRYHSEKSGILNRVDSVVAKELREFIEQDILSKSRYNYLSGGSLFKFFVGRR